MTRGPVVEGERVIFRWQSDDPPDEVVGDFNGWGQLPQQFRRLDGSWQTTIILGGDAYIEYAFLRDGRRVLDPHNPNRVSNGIGEVNNYFAMPDWKPSPHLRPRRNVPKGELTRHSVSEPFRVTGGKRDVWVYRQAAKPVGLLVVLDGQDYIRRGRLPIILDNLIAGGNIMPIAAIMVKHGGQARMIEYACSGATIDFLTNEVIPLARSVAGVSDDATVGVLGPSMGGLMALCCGFTRPDVFRVVISQSGAFGLTHGGRLLLHSINSALPPDIRIRMSVGRYESLLAVNRELAETLLEKGYDITFREFAGGHNWTSWRNELEHALAGSFMVESA